MQNIYTFTFTTGDLPGPVPPKVISTLPKNGDLDVSVKTSIQIGFNKAMDKALTAGAISSLPPISWAAGWSNGDMTVTLVPNAELGFDTDYYFTVSTKAESADWVKLAAECEFTFRTESGPIVVHPEVQSTNPANGSTNVDPSTNITIIFTKSMYEPSVEDSLTLSPGSISSIQWDSSCKTMTIVPRLEEGRTYTISISTPAQDLNGVHLQSRFWSKFTTKGAMSNGGGSGAGIDVVTLVLSFLIVIAVAIAITLIILLRMKRHIKCPECARPLEKGEYLCPQCGFDLIRRKRGSLADQKATEGRRPPPTITVVPIEVKVEEDQVALGPPPPHSEEAQRKEAGPPEEQEEEGSERKKRILEKLKKLKEQREGEKGAE
jgi:hypothetical protein